MNKDWAAEEARLWNLLMDPRTYSAMKEEEPKSGKKIVVVPEAKKVARSWRLYSDWIRH
jgi:hypothetical protein